MHIARRSTTMMFFAQKIIVYLLLSIINALSGTGSQLYSADLQQGDDEYIRVNLSQSFLYYTAAQDTLFVSQRPTLVLNRSSYLILIL